MAAGDHGNYCTYTNHGCRCPLCTEAQRERQAGYRAKIRAKATPWQVHGTSNGYVNYACRCELCSEFNSTDSKRRRHRKIQEQDRAAEA